jgi:hypothetical protein
MGFQNIDPWLGALRMPTIGSFLLMGFALFLVSVAEQAPVFSDANTGQIRDALGGVLLMFLLGGLLYGWYLPEFTNTHVLHYYGYENWAVKTSKVVCSGLGGHIAVRGAHLWMTLGLLGVVLWGGYHLLGWIFS